MEQVAEVAEVKKVSIRPNTEGMIKTKGGSFHKNDFIGTTLAGLTVAQVKTIAEEVGVDVTKYEHLNAGQQRMTIGNALRKMAPEGSETAGLIADEARAAKEVNAAEAVAKAEAKEAAKQAKADAKAAAKLAKADAKKPAEHHDAK